MGFIKLMFNLQLRKIYTGYQMYFIKYVFAMLISMQQSI
jgi:hypothetical protein